MNRAGVSNPPALAEMREGAPQGAADAPNMAAPVITAPPGVS
jgi:hypothetical protein